ncbi:tRNA pseudouridine(55) synthase TruB [Schleiferiaceae bacterium]|jgi:tRNA pseudouridine55 synthase|nr:tRNA pseudouridine(55) synthase TruB [Schleiferiaceae bacterium]
MNIPPDLETLQEGWILSVDKPLGWTSFDVVAKVRNALKRRYGAKVKIGHAGTLDPLATGVLVLCAGRATKTIPHWVDTPKGYRASIQLGATTASYDAETEAIPSGQPIPAWSALWAERLTAKFTGEIDQIPPVFSAVRVDGKRAYAEARKGKEVEMPSRKVTIHELKFLETKSNPWLVEVACSKGTYIRSLAHDFGTELGCGAYLSGLVRHRVGDFTLEESHSMEEVLSALAVVS